MQIELLFWLALTKKIVYTVYQLGILSGNKGIVFYENLNKIYRRWTKTLRWKSQQGLLNWQRQIHPMQPQIC
jgi:hypothetical protein